MTTAKPSTDRAAAAWPGTMSQDESPSSAKRRAKAPPPRSQGAVTRGHTIGILPVSQAPRAESPTAIWDPLPAESARHTAPLPLLHIPAELPIVLQPTLAALPVGEQL
jgi:hypothetical protein